MVTFIILSFGLTIQLSFKNPGLKSTLGQKCCYAATGKQYSIKTESAMTSSIMHMSSACPRGRSPGQPGGYVGKYKGWIGFSAPGEGKIRDIVLSSKKRGWGNSKFCKIVDGNNGDTTGIYHFPQPRNAGNIKWRKGEFSDEKTRFQAAEFLQRPGDDSLEDWE